LAHIQWYGSESDTYRKIVRNNPGIGAYNFARMTAAKGIAEGQPGQRSQGAFACRGLSRHGRRHG